MTPSRTLDHLSVGSSAVVAGFCGDDCTCARLQAMGFIEGSELCLSQKMSFGGPLAITIRGTKIALRRQDAACLLVK